MDEFMLQLVVQQEMEARETEILTGLGFPNPYSDREGMVHD